MTERMNIPYEKNHKEFMSFLNYSKVLAKKNLYNRVRRYSFDFSGGDEDCPVSSC